MKKTIFFYFLGVLIACVSCTAKQERKKDKQKIFYYNESANITSLDPAFARAQPEIWAVNQLFNGLLQLDDSLRIKPCIAKKWFVEDGGKKYRFLLRNDVFFHNDPVFQDGKGRRVTAPDFVFSFNRILDEKIASPGAWIFSHLRKDIVPFNAINDSVLEIYLEQPFPPFPGLLAMQYCSVVAPEAVAQYGKDIRNHPIGTGPFRFKHWTEGVKMILVKNEAYFERDEKNNRLPYLDAVSISFVSNKQAAFVSFLKGQLDFLSGLDASYKDELLTNTGKLQPKYAAMFHMQSQPYLNTEFLGILVDEKSDLVQKSPLRFKYVRQAINCCFDREKMIRHLRNNIGTPAYAGFVPPGLPSFDSTAVRGYRYDPDKARALLAKAGFTDGKEFPEISLSTTAAYADICEYVQRQAAEVGIKIKVDVMQSAALREFKASAKLPFFRASWIADYPDAENYLALFYSKNFSPAGPNDTHFKNSRYDKLYEAALATTNEKEHYRLYREMDRIIMEECPVVPLYYDEVVRFYSRRIEGLGSNAMNLLNLKKVNKQ